MKLYSVKFVNWSCTDYVVADSVDDVETIGCGVRDKDGMNTGAEIESVTLIAGGGVRMPSLLMRKLEEEAIR